MNEDDKQAFISWAAKRNGWLWKHAYRRATWPPLRAVLRRAAVTSLKVDYFYWRHLRL